MKIERVHTYHANGLDHAQRYTRSYPIPLSEYLPAHIPPVVIDLVRNIAALDAHTFLHTLIVTNAYQKTAKDLGALFGLHLTHRLLNDLAVPLIHDVGKLSVSKRFGSSTDVINAIVTNPQLHAHQPTRNNDSRSWDIKAQHELHPVLGARLLSYIKKDATGVSENEWLRWTLMTKFHHERVDDLRVVLSPALRRHPDMGYINQLWLTIEMADTIAALSVPRIYQPQPGPDEKIVSIVKDLVMSQKRLEIAFGVDQTRFPMIQHMIAVSTRETMQLIRQKFSPNICLNPDKHDWHDFPQVSTPFATAFNDLWTHNQGQIYQRINSRGKYIPSF